MARQPVQLVGHWMYNEVMDVGTATLRAELKHYLDLVRSGEEIVVTDRNVPIAPTTAVESGPSIEELTRSGVIAAPAQSPRRRAAGAARIHASGSVSDLVTEQRR